MNTYETRREVLLVLLGSPGPISADEITRRAMRDLQAVREALAFLVMAGVARQNRDSNYLLPADVLAALTVLGKGSAPLDRHVAEALAVREGRI